MKGIGKIFVWCVWLLLPASRQKVSGQGIHFSQYYNAPLLVNPANTGLMPDHHYRAGAGYRDQWASVPVPYRTASVYADFQALHGEVSNNWLGLGIAFFNDQAGNGNLSQNKIEGFVAYHLSIGYSSMLSAGLSGGYVQRSVDMSQLTFDSQWDGLRFNGSLSSNERGMQASTNYLDVGAGLNYAYFPSDAVYFKLGVGVAHVNRPKESFYNHENRLGLRPSVNMDVLLKVSRRFIMNPSAYGTMQKNAGALVVGSLFHYLLGDEYSDQPKQLLLGAYYRLGDALIPAFGFDIGSFRIMSSYDFTISGLSPYNRGKGAFEIGVRYQGMYGFKRKNDYSRELFSCPRF